MTALISKKFSFKRIAILVCLLFIQCNAPRENPFDPENPDNDLGEITGTVKTLSVPPAPLDNASVYWATDNVLVKTNKFGKFNICNILPRQGNLVFTKDGYMPDTVSVSWSADGRYDIDVNLNAFPQTDSLIFYTKVVNSFPAIQDMSLIVSVGITDQDNDIDSIYIQNDYWGLKRQLTYDHSIRLFEDEFIASDLNVGSIRQIVGYTFGVYVKDRYNHTIHLGNGRAIRTILDQITMTSPTANKEVGKNPLLEWELFEPGFDFQLNIEVYKYDFERTLVWSKSNISSDSTSVLIDQALPEGDYYWWIWCVDPFQNQSRSKPASFTVVY